MLERQSQIKLEAFLLGEKDPVRTGILLSLYMGIRLRGNLRSEPRNLQNHFRKYQEACRLRTVNFHALRHTFATRCIESGVDIKALSEILGHASVNITLNRYVHSSPEMKRRNMEKVRPLCRSDKVTEEVSPILAD